MCTRLLDPPPEDVVSTYPPYGGAFGPLDFERNTIAFNISRDTALILGLVEPTPEEAAEMAANAAEWDRKNARLRQADGAMLAALRAKNDPATNAVLDLHVGTGSDYPECEGDDFTGAEAERPEWPCRTVLALAKAHGVPTREDVQ